MQSDTASLEACGTIGVMGQLIFNEVEAQAMEAVYRIREAQIRRSQVRAELAPQAGERILDVGCGPGFYCREFADVVGSIVGVDQSEAMIRLARRRCEGLENVSLHVADATALGVADGDFDAAYSVQVFEYVADTAAGLAELHRALRPGGRVLVWDTDWRTFAMQDDELTRRVHRAWDEHLAHRSLPRVLARSLREAGFEDVRARAYPLATVDFDPETYGGALVPFIAAFVPGHAGVSQADAEAWIAEQQALGERGEFYFAVTQFCFTARKPA
jgi:ubiquinone/menaquinone biosynthesis C-methylase UbiE